MARSKANTRKPTRKSSTAQPAPASNSLASKIAAEAFGRALLALHPPARFGVAVSGGADSLACLCLTADWARNLGRPLPHAVTVDHGLRKGSLKEARTVARWAKALGCAHSILRWTGEKPGADIQAEAREARYRLLAGWATKAQIGAVLTGHTSDDVAETFLMRLARGSGLYGLAAMDARQPLQAGRPGPPWLLRPMLGLSHADAMAVLRSRGQAWIEDPSNQNPRFARVQARKALGLLSGLGLTPERLARTAFELARARDAVAQAVEKFLTEAAHASRGGTVSLNTEALTQAPQEVALRALAHILRSVAGAAYAPRFEHTEALFAWIVSGTGPRSRTLGGCLVTRKPSTILFAREWAALLHAAPSAILRPGQAVLWDGRFWVWLPRQPRIAGLTVRAVGDEGLAQLSKQERAATAKSAPALWKGEVFDAALPLLEPSVRPPQNLKAAAAAFHWPVRHGVSDREPDRASPVSVE